MKQACPTTVHVRYEASLSDTIVCDMKQAGPMKIKHMS
jgi:hypothetical protein